jgi:hypothetical protein
MGAVAWCGGVQPGEAQMGRWPRLRARVGAAHVHPAGLPPAGELLANARPRFITALVPFLRSVQHAQGAKAGLDGRHRMRADGGVAPGAGGGAGERRLRDPRPHRHRAVRLHVRAWPPACSSKRAEAVTVPVHCTWADRASFLCRAASARSGRSCWAGFVW